MIRELIGLSGCAAVSCGVGMYSRPAGIITFGLFVIAYAIFGFENGKKTGR